MSPEAMKPFSEPEQLKDQLELTTACLVCGKPLKKQAKGSLTGWIFDNDYRAITDRWMCSCAPGGATVKLQLSTDEATVPDNASTSHELSRMPGAPLAEGDGLAPLRKTLLNTTINNQWQITSVLESGHMGTVYVAQDLANQRTVVIKVLRSELSGNSRIVKRFLQECEKAVTIGHKNIVGVYDSGKLPDGSGFVVMDYIEGENLETKIRKEGFLDVDEALDLFIDLTLALEHAHSQGVIHRGLKPTNILFASADDNAKISDFGVAKAIPSIGKETIQLSAIADIFGDPMCMSPEQCLGEDVDARSDIYSLACVMYYALTGKPPFLFQNGCQTAMAHVSHLPPPFKETMFNCDIPAKVESVVMRALEKDAEDRYQTMAQLRADLEVLKRGGTPVIPKPKRAGKRRVLQLSRADVVSTNPRDLMPPTGTALSNPTSAVAKVNTQVATVSAN
ncbi:MAG TPA: serine/threonine-protein kinase, partial [Trichormus sp.]